MLLWSILLLVCGAGLWYEHKHGSRVLVRNDSTEAKDAAAQANNATAALGYGGPPVVPPLGEAVAGLLLLARRGLP
jgi:hypothetical protein